MKYINNNNNRSRIIFLQAIAIVFALTACKRQLREGPIGATTGDKFWTTQTSVEQAASAMYGQLRSSLRANAGGNDRQDASHFIFGDLTTGVFLAGPGSTFLNYGLPATNNPPFNFSYVPYWADALQNWTRFYQVIALTNQIIENVGNMPAGVFSSAQKRNAYIGEALFMRAYCYFYITRVWGDPVYVSKVYNDVDYGNVPPLARTPEAQVLDSCLRDLSIAAGYMNYTGGEPSLTTRANKGSAEALKAHIFAWKHQYDSAHFYCQKVITSGGYALESMANYSNIWKGKSSRESIFELNMLYNSSDANFGKNNWAEAQYNFFACFLKGPIVNNERENCWMVPKDGTATAIFDTTLDARFKSVMAYQQPTGGDKEGYMLKKYTNFLYQNTNSKTGPYINNNLVLLRLADIILLDAEALASLGRLEEARNMLKLTETRAGISSYQSPANQYDMMDEVVMERGRELIGEGCWFYDLIRTNEKQSWLEYVGYPADRVKPQNKGYYWPLDMATLFPYDNLLTQNPWWVNNTTR